MKMLKKFRRWTIGLALAALVSPQFAAAAQPAAPQTQPNAVRTQKVADVALHKGGLIVGQVGTRQGAPKAGAKVVMTQRTKVVAVAETDKQGRFAVRGLRGGVYQVQVDQNASMIRLWAERTAPPAARPAALMVSDSEVALGQNGSSTGRVLTVVGAGLAGGGIVWGLDYNKPGS